MPTIRTFPAALATIACALTIAPATSHAALPDPVWLEPQTIAPTGAGSSGQSVTGGATPIGGAWAAWNITESGENRIVFNYRPPGGDWGTPATLGPEDATTSFSDWTATPDGTITLAYYVQETNSVYTQNVSATTGAISEPELISDPERGSGCGDLHTTADGTTYLVWCAAETYMRVRAPGSSEWGPAEAISETDTSGQKMTLTPAGDIVLFYNQSSPSRLKSITRPAGSSEWSDPVTLANTSNDLSPAQPIVDADGRVVALWLEVSGGTAQAYSAIYDGSWAAPAPVGDPGTIGGGFAVAGNGDLVSVRVQTPDFTSFSTYAGALTRGGSSWGAETSLNPPGEMSGVLGITARADGSVYGAMLHGASPMSFDLGVISRGASSSTWTGPSDLTGVSVSTMDGGFISADPLGNLVIGWKDTAGTPVVVAADGAGPALNDLSVPSSVQAGEAAAVSVTALDAWSELDSVSWSFGDGTTKSGTSASHTYASPGTYTVTVTATDSLGHASSTTRTITVAAPPAPPAEDADEPEKKKVVLPPVLEARLSGKTVTLNARVTLKARKRCTGNTTATTAFGGRTYRTTLKLKTVGGACRATGTLKLKKTPSLRTKLRITISGKQTKTRTLTTKRG